MRAISTRRLATSITNKMWNRTSRSGTTFAVKKSMAAISPQCARRNALQGHAFALLGHRNDAGLEQDEFGCVAADLVAEVEQRTANARVAPSAVLLGHAQHERDDVE